MCLSGGSGGSGAGDPKAKERLRSFFTPPPAAEEPEAVSPVLARFRSRNRSLLASAEAEGEPVNQVRKRFQQQQKLGS